MSMTVYLLALLIGVVAGLRAMTAPERSAPAGISDRGVAISR